MKFVNERAITAMEEIDKAKKWAERIWADASVAWSQRPSQDYAYREYVVEPAVTEILPQINLSSSSKILEIGCGDASHLLFWKKLLAKNNLATVQLVGLDLIESQIEKARKRLKEPKDISLLMGDATDTKTAEIIIERFERLDLIVAMFLLQDTPELEGTLNVVTTCLKEDGHLLAVFVHPNFAQHLYERGYVKKAEEDYLSKEHISASGIVQWRFAGYYPIAQKDASPFYLPYFHRAVNDYLDALNKKHLTVIAKKDLMLAPDVAERLQEAKISPFYKEKHNIYWPLIVKEPSALLIHAKMEKGK